MTKSTWIEWSKAIKYGRPPPLWGMNGEWDGGKVGEGGRGEGGGTEIGMQTLFKNNCHK